MAKALEWFLTPYQAPSCSKEDLQVGDHIYTYRIRSLSSYAHHGIFVGEGKVIHFTSTKDPQQSLKCNKLECDDGKNGVGMVCIDCFIKDGWVRRYAYSSFMGSHPGTFYPSDDVATVCRRAYTLLNDNPDGSSFGVYDLATHNCEDFSIYCKTGILDPRRGLSQQIQMKKFMGASSSEEPHACFMRRMWENNRFRGSAASAVVLERDCPAVVAAWRANKLSPRHGLLTKLCLHKEENRFWRDGPDPALVWPLEMLLYCYREDDTVRNSRLSLFGLRS